MTKKLLNKKIVILDACTVSNGDVDFGTFESLGDVKIYDVLNGDELTEACREAEVLLVNKTRVDEKLISACPRLELICLFATGYDNVDIEAAKRRGITVCNVPRYSAQSVTQHVFAMLLEYVRNISRFESFVANGGWTREGGRAIFAYPIENLAGKTFGVIGYGRIGQATARLAAAFGMKVVAFDSFVQDGGLAEMVSLEELLARSDVISLHCPLTPQTQNIIHRGSIARMKDGASKLALVLLEEATEVNVLFGNASNLAQQDTEFSFERKLQLVQELRDMLTLAGKTVKMSIC